MNADNIPITTTDNIIIGITKAIFIYPEYPSQIASAGIKEANSTRITRIVNIAIDLIRLIGFMFFSLFLLLKIYYIISH